jgi:uncharacterized protein with HEPN domain
MVKRSVRIRLEDILENVDGVVELVVGLSFADYQANFGLRRAVERCVEIVSEASRHIPDEIKEKHPNAYWPEIRAIGNLLRHQYQRVDDLVMWRIATIYFPELRKVVADMLDGLDV